MPVEDAAPMFTNTKKIIMDGQVNVKWHKNRGDRHLFALNLFDVRPSFW